MKPQVPIVALVIVAVAASLCGCGQSETNAARPPVGDGSGGFVPDTKPVPLVKWLDATVPNGTPIMLSLIDTLNSRSTRKGDPFRALVTDAIIIDGTVIVPSGSNVLGVVSEVVPAATGFKNKGGMLLLEFNRIDTPTGASASLKARLKGLSPARSSAVLAGASDPGAIAAGTKGREAVLDPGTPLTIVLEETLRVKVRQ